jgi:hypothetical protein
MAELKTKENNKSVKKFLVRVKDVEQREDCLKLLKIFEDVTGENATMWGSSIIGFGKYHYKYASGREGDWPITGFSPRKDSISIYLMCDLKKNKELLKKLGPHKNGVSCLYIKKLEDIKIQILKRLIKDTIEYSNNHYK